jgi:hypothetical protein
MLGLSTCVVGAAAGLITRTRGVDAIRVADVPFASRPTPLSGAGSMGLKSWNSMSEALVPSGRTGWDMNGVAQRFLFSNSPQSRGEEPQQLL